MGYIHSAKGQEISKAIFHETPLPKKGPKFVDGFLPMALKWAK